MLKRVYLTVIAILCNYVSFAISPHGVRVDDIDRGHYSKGSGDAAGLIVILIVIVIAGVLIAIGSSSPPKSNNRPSSKPSQKFSSKSLYDNYLAYLEEQRRIAEKEDEDFRKGCFWVVLVFMIWFIIYVANSFFNFI